MEPRIEAALGLIGSSKDTKGSEVRVGSRIRLIGRIMRIHSSGFAIVEIEGPNPQPAVIVWLGNSEAIG